MKSGSRESQMYKRFLLAKELSNYQIGSSVSLIHENLIRVRKKKSTAMFLYYSEWSLLSKGKFGISLWGWKKGEKKNYCDDSYNNCLAFGGCFHHLDYWFTYYMCDWLLTLTMVTDRIGYFHLQLQSFTMSYCTCYEYVLVSCNILDRLFGEPLNSPLNAILCSCLLLSKVSMKDNTFSFLIFFSVQGSNLKVDTRLFLLQKNYCETLKIFLSLCRLFISMDCGESWMWYLQRGGSFWVQFLSSKSLNEGS